MFNFNYFNYDFLNILKSRRITIYSSILDFLKNLPTSFKHFIDVQRKSSIRSMDARRLLMLRPFLLD